VIPVSHFNENVILSIIAKNQSFEPIFFYQVNKENIMFTYGSDDEFKEIIDEIEDTFGFIFPTDEYEYAVIGEMKVKDFIALIMKLAEESDKS
jgi:DUF1365 family protein